jgi:hypothetical protein
MTERGMIIAVALMLGCMTAVSVGDAQETRGGPPDERIRNVPQPLPPSAPVGSPAITARTGGTPAFTVDDVKQYVATHALPMAASGDAKPAITRVEFVTSQTVSERLNGTTTGFPADYPLCFVELQGPFTFSGPGGTKVTYNRGVLIFDAKTGNLVIGGGMP